MPRAGDFEPLTEEEVNFCWRGLVDQGQLSVQKLQQFMQDISGEKLSVVQAKDLLNYMDADGNGVVGMEDFKNFISIGRLEDTDPKSFMWTPKQRWREQHPESVKTDDDPPQPPVASSSSSANFSGEMRGGKESPESPKIMSHGVEPKAPPGKRRGPARAHGARSTQAAVPEEEVAPPEPEPAPKEAAAPERPRPSPAPALDPAYKKFLEDSIEKYEQETWEKLLQEEEAFKRRLFAQFGSPDSNELTTTEYHKMLTKWHRLARWCMPCDIRPGDSLAALEYILNKERQSRGGGDAGGEAGGSGDAGAAAAAGAHGEARLSYRVWLDLINGKYRPEDHVTAKSGH